VSDLYGDGREGHTGGVCVVHHRAALDARLRLLFARARQTYARQTPVRQKNRVLTHESGRQRHSFRHMYSQKWSTTAMLTGPGRAGESFTGKKDASLYWLGEMCVRSVLVRGDVCPVCTGGWFGPKSAQNGM